MKILLYLAAGNGDLINFTGILHIIKCTYPDYIIDFLVLKKQSDILKNNPCINESFIIIRSVFNSYIHIHVIIR